MRAASATRSEAVGALLWSAQPVAVALAVPSVPPLLQATLVTTTALLVLWLWTRWRDIPVFAQDATLRPGVMLGLWFSARMALLYAAVARLGAAGAVEASAALLLLLAVLAGRRRWPPQAALLALLALGVLLPGLERVGAVLAVLSALAWAAQELVSSDARLMRCAGEKFVFYQLIGAAVSLPVVSVVAGENWLVAPAPVAWVSLLVQVAAALLAAALLWIAPPRRRRRQRLPAMLGIAPAAALVLQSLCGTVPPPAYWVTAALLLGAARWPRRRRRRRAVRASG